MAVMEIAFLEVAWKKCKVHESYVKAAGTAGYHVLADMYDTDLLALVSRSPGANYPEDRELTSTPGMGFNRDRHAWNSRH